MFCPFCRNDDTRVIDTRVTDDGSVIRRRRQCRVCDRRFSTVESAALSVVKRSGVIEVFSRDKVIAGVRKALQGRPVAADEIALLAQRVEETLRMQGMAEVDSHQVGLAILGPLRELDEVAYLRFASVYEAFETVEDFEAAIAKLRGTHKTETSADKMDKVDKTAQGAAVTARTPTSTPEPGAARAAAAGEPATALKPATKTTSRSARGEQGTLV